jgi:hypothetical protein
MRGLVAALGIPLLLTLTFAARGQAPKAAPPKAVQQKSSFVDRVLSFLGISDSPGTLKGIIGLPCLPLTARRSWH